eukprot:767243-Hanusia_phi.AAC.2
MPHFETSESSTVVPLYEGHKCISLRDSNGSSIVSSCIDDGSELNPHASLFEFWSHSSSVIRIYTKRSKTACCYCNKALPESLGDFLLSEQTQSVQE